MAKVIVLSTTGLGSWTVPADWTSNDNTIHLIGGGAGGMPSGSINAGGGGGGYTKVTNFAAYSGQTISYVVGAGGTANSAGANTTFSSNTYVAGGGGNGQANTGIGGIGLTFNGGNGSQGSIGSAGGGGAAGFYGAGQPGNGTTGGAGDNGAGGTGGVSPYAPAGNGTEIAGGVGSGGGGAGNSGVNSIGGLYGGGGGKTTSGAAGAQGVIIITYQNSYNQYTPYTAFFTTDPNTSNTQDLGQRYVTKSYLLDVYPNLVPGRTSPGLFFWGQNSNGQLGLNDTTHRSSPVQVGSLTNWKQVSGGYSTAAIKTDGTLWAWGLNTNGQLGTNNITHRSSPVQIGSLTNWKQVSAGSGFTSAIKTDGTLWAWGQNQFYGQLGTGDITHRSSPVQIGSLTNWKQVSAGSGFTSAIKTDGTLWSWGSNQFFGQLGTGDITHRSSPVQIGSLANWKLVSAGPNNSTAAIKTDGTLWAWGRNDAGGLGTNDITHRSSPVQVGSLTNWKQVSTGQFSTSAIKTDGTLWAWGSNLFGELGTGDTIYYSSPVQIGSLTNWKLVSAGEYCTTAIKTDGTLWTWGYNNYGQLGTGDTNFYTRSSPVQVGSLTNWKQVSAAGSDFISAISDGSY